MPGRNNRIQFGLPCGLSIEKRYNHTLYIESYPKGRDAAIAYPDLDLVWKNDTTSDVFADDVIHLNIGNRYTMGKSILSIRFLRNTVNGRRVNRIQPRIKPIIRWPLVKYVKNNGRRREQHYYCSYGERP